MEQVIIDYLTSIKNELQQTGKQKKLLELRVS